MIAMQERRDLSSTLRDSKTVVAKLEVILLVVLHIILLLIIMLIFSVSLSSANLQPHLAMQS